MEAFQTRVIEEKAELDEKIEKLQAFFGTDIYPTLDTAEQMRLQMQHHLMTGYSLVLQQRIEAFS